MANFKEASIDIVLKEKSPYGYSWRQEMFEFQEKQNSLPAILELSWARD